MSTLAQLVTKVRQDLRDTAAPQEFTDAELERWLGRALAEVSAARGREQKTALTTAASRDLSLSTLSLLLRVVGIEYPTLQWPPTYVRFTHWGAVATLHIDNVPAAGEAVNVLWESAHFLDGVGSSMDPRLEEIVVLGGGAYALEAYASKGANTLLTAGSTGQRALAGEAERLLRLYGAELRRLRGRVRRREMYVPAEPGPSQSTDPGPP
jgi:hypothetical protein